uniref:NB-ARC domain-containing protein n=2 Tax=Triticum urartu TaxID=4572 RepID=A0A8R7VB03_TRIUA
MGTAAAGWLVGKVLNMLSDDLVAAYMDSKELGLNSEKIKGDLMRTHGLLQAAQARGMGDNDGLRELVQALNAKPHEAEDTLDELHYFIIQDQLDGTQYAVPDLGDGLSGLLQHGCHAVRHTIGNCLAYFSCSCVHGGAGAAAAENPSSSTIPGNGNDAPLERLTFDRVAMSNKIKSVIQEMHSLCAPIAELLQIDPDHINTPNVTIKRPITSSVIAQVTLYGRTTIFEKTRKDIIGGTYQNKTLSVLPIVGPGGIGKTTFTQHLYKDNSIQEHFDVRVWVSVPTHFDVLKISQQILSCIEGSNTANQTTSLDHLQKSIAQRLQSKRFLIVFDDMWKCNIHDWDNLLAPFKEEVLSKGNMVLVTTRIPTIANIVKTTHAVALKGLEPAEFFRLFEDLIYFGTEPEDYRDDLTHIARKISEKLKGSPLAAKTVGRLLKRDISLEHWVGVLEHNEWQKEQNEHDIMPSLRISYHNLPLHLKRCFSYFALFPGDYKFKNLEITYFWISIGVINKEEKYVEEFVDNGFLVKETDGSEDHYYVLHDLLHQLSQSISSQECLNIYSSESFRSDVIPRSIRYISITMGNSCDANFRREMFDLKSKIDIVNLRALMIFGKYGRVIHETLEDAFKEVGRLRVLFIEFKTLETWPHNFSKLIHLRCLKISTSLFISQVSLPITLCRFYHLKLLDLIGWHGSVRLPKDFSRLISLRQLFAENELHSNVTMVGKMKYLKELKQFYVKKESVGYELSELGKLTDLGGELNIYNLEKVATKEEAIEAKIVLKKDLKKLHLVWGTNQHNLESDVLDGLEPHCNLGALGIIDHGGSTGPRWLCHDIRMVMLTSLHLEGISWVTLPLFGLLLHLTSLTLSRISRLSQIRPGLCGVTDKSFMQLKQIILHSLPEFIEWVGVPNAHSFSKLEYIHCSSCPNLCVLPFLQEGPNVSYNHLAKLEILSCPKLFLPSMPHTSTITDVVVANASSVSTGISWHSGHGLYLTRYGGVLAWHDIIDRLQSVKFVRGSEIQWEQLSKVKCLWNLEIIDDPRFLSIAPLSNLTSLTRLGLLNCENITMDGFNPLITLVNLKELEVYNKDHPRSVAADLLSDLVMASRAKNVFPATGSFFQLEKLEVDSSSAALVAPICTLLAATLQELSFWYDKRVESLTDGEENALQLLTSLQHLSFVECQGLPSLPQRLHDLSSLKKLEVIRCAKIRSLPKEGIPNSLKELVIVDCGPELREQVYTVKQKYPDLQV